MMRTRARLIAVTVVAILYSMPVVASAQSVNLGAIAGVVKDSSGAVLPGVTVEVSSLALIERTRSATTDSEGLYKIVDLRPGNYAVTFSLEGFSTMKRDGIDLSAGFTATVNAELRIGALSESLTVSGQAPMVDTFNTRQQTVVNRDVMDTVPTARTGAAISVLIPGVVAAGSASGTTAHDVGGSNGDKQPYLMVHGSKGIEMPRYYDGMRYSNMNGRAGGGCVIWTENNGTVEEYTVEVGSMSIDADVSGVRANSIPRSGGNVPHFLFFTNYTNSNLQAQNNVDDPKYATVFNKIWDINPSAGGPIKENKLWYFASYRYWGTYEHPPGAYPNLNGPLAYTYTADTSQPAINQNWNQSEDLRLTWQVNDKNKISFWANQLQKCQCAWMLSSTRSPESAAKLRTYPDGMFQLTYSAPLTNRWLLDSGFTFHPEAHSNAPQDEVTFGTASITESTTGITYRAPATSFIAHTWQSNGKFYANYVTGTHAFKFGLQDMFGKRIIQNWAMNPYAITLTNGIPNSLTLTTYPYNSQSNLKYYLGLFAADQWTLGRITLNYGLRFDANNAYVPAQSYPAAPLVGARSFPFTQAQNWKDINPRLGVAYNLFGDGKTAVKASIARYVDAVTTAIADLINPIATSVNSATRQWIGGVAGQLTPNCDLTNPAANGQCGPTNPSNFGQSNVVTTWDPSVLNGWGARPHDWELQTSIQHEIRTGLSVSGTYTRHWYGSYLANDNLLTTPSDYSPFCVNAPLDPRLPNGGGNPICGIYDINPDKFGKIQNLVTKASNYGNVSDVYNGVDFVASLRPGRGSMLQGGFSVGHEVYDNCDVVGKVDNATGGAAPADIQRSGTTEPLFTNINGMASPTTLYCRVDPPLQTQVKLMGSYPLPWSLMLSGSLQSLPGSQITATYNARVATNPEILQTLGRSLSAGANAITAVQLIAPATLYRPRYTQLDLRLTRSFKTAGDKKYQLLFDLYNALNTNAILNMNLTYGPLWQTPTYVLPGRMFKFGLQMTL